MGEINQNTCFFFFFLVFNVCFFFSFFFSNFILFLNLHNCISFAKYQNESATGIHVFPIEYLLVKIILVTFLKPLVCSLELKFSEWIQSTNRDSQEVAFVKERNIRNKEDMKLLPLTTTLEFLM